MHAAALRPRMSCRYSFKRACHRCAPPRWYKPVPAVAARVQSRRFGRLRHVLARAAFDTHACRQTLQFCAKLLQNRAVQHGMRASAELCGMLRRGEHIRLHTAADAHGFATWPHSSSSTHPNPDRRAALLCSLELGVCRPAERCEQSRRILREGDPGASTSMKGCVGSAS